MIKEGVRIPRKTLVEYLEKHKIITRLLFAGNLSKQPAVKDVKYRIVGSLRNTDLMMNNGFWIGVWPELNEEHLEYFVQCFKKFFVNVVSESCS